MEMNNLMEWCLKFCIVVTMHILGIYLKIYTVEPRLMSLSSSGNSSSEQFVYIFSLI